jgi:putative spermidine/putrescine transport system ATP-binding protein
MRHVSRSFGKTEALRDLDLVLAAGEFVALLGPSGCGKSTALACLAGLQPLSGGEIWIDKRRLDTLPAERRGFGMVFQSYALFPHLTVQKNVEFGLRMRKVKAAQRHERALAALRTVQLEDHAQKHPAQLSGGQQQRVAIARALAIEPDIVLMDEPLSNLDAALRIGLRTEIKRLHQNLGLTTLYVTHDQEEALSLADRVVILRDGCVEQAGTPEAVYNRPVSPYVAKFMGYRNVLAAHAASGGDAGEVVEVRRGAQVLHATAVEPITAGSEVTIAVRPEDVLVSSIDDNGLVAVAEVVEFMGREIQVGAGLPDGQVLHLRTEKPVAAGDSIRIGVPRQRLLAYAGNAA